MPRLHDGEAGVGVQARLAVVDILQGVQRGAQSAERGTKRGGNQGRTERWRVRDYVSSARGRSRFRSSCSRA